MMNILVVDDSKGTREEVAKSLRAEGLIKNIFEAENGVKALKIISKGNIDLIITDVIMPKMDGFKLIKTLQADSRYQHIPVVLLTVRSRLSDRVKGLDLGASDFLVKPVHPVELSARVRAMLRVKNLQDQMKDRLMQLEHLSVIDGLTGLYNKSHLLKFLQQEVNRKNRFQYSISCLLIDVDNFKMINDTHGHVKADRILNELGGLLNEHVRGYDFAARYGGDEFTLILPHQKNGKGGIKMASRLCTAVAKKPFLSKKDGGPVHITVSVGVVTLRPNSRKGIDALLERADKALYKAKANGKNQAVAL